MKQINDKLKVKNYYDQEASVYLNQYQKGFLEYPANLIRLKILIKRLKDKKLHKLLDVGCGSCGPIIKLLQEGFFVRGFDFAKEMVEQGKMNLKKAGFNPDIIFQADLENMQLFPRENFDAILALGVFPHILNEHKALLNMKKLLKLKGYVFIEFRNDLFAAFTLNKYSLDFFLNRVINVNNLPKTIQNELMEFYLKKFGMDINTNKQKKNIVYKDILAKFYNPLTINKELFEPAGFDVQNIHFYHYHALPPIFESKYPKLFRNLSLKMEKSSDWKGYLMASAYVIEARRRT